MKFLATPLRGYFKLQETAGLRVPYGSEVGNDDPQTKAGE